MNSFIEDNVEKMKFICSIKNCRKNVFYKMIIINREKDFGNFICLETEELENKEEKGDLIFNELKGINYYFHKNQMFRIQIIKREFKNFQYVYDSYERSTCIASLINSPNSKYERKLNQNMYNSETFCVELVKEDFFNFKNSEIYRSSIIVNEPSLLEYFKLGSKLKFYFLYDFSNKNNDNEYLKSLNIFNSILIYCYNYYHLYTEKDEAFIYGTGAIFNKRKNNTKYFNINLKDDFSMIKTYQKAYECLINCLNLIKKEKNIYIFPFLDKVINNIQNNKQIYNIIILCLRNINDVNDIENTLNLINEKKDNKLPLSIVLIRIKDKSDLNKSKYNIYQENSKLIYIEIETKNDINISMNNCFTKIGENIKKFYRFINNYEEDTHDNDDEKFNNDLPIEDNNNNDKIRTEDLKNSLPVKVVNPYLKNKKNIIKESENESESTEKGNNSSLKKDNK